MRKVIIFLILIAVSLTTAAQNSIVSKQTYVYSIKGTDTLRLDRYYSQKSANQPCIVFVFGGGFYTGSRDNEGNVKYMKRLVENGYNAVSIDYRLGLKDMKTKQVNGRKGLISLFENTINMAVEDLFDATTFVYNHADEWNINRDMIIANGSSAGAITVLQGEYYICSNNSLSSKLPKGFNYAGVIAFAGAIYSNTGKPKWQQKPCPIQLFHGDADSNVPFSKVRVFKYGLFGSAFIAKQLDKMKSPYYFYKVENAGHEMAGKPMIDNITEIVSFIEEYVINHNPLSVTVAIKQLNKPEKKKNFGLKDYIRSNFGR